MKVLVNTNVILDVFLKREPFFQSSYKVLRLAATDQIECLVSATAATDVYYLLNKGLQSAEKARACMEKLLQLVSFADVLSGDIPAALCSEVADFEDAVASVVAARNKAAYIITRNAKHFSGASVQALTPQDFLSLMS